MLKKFRIPMLSLAMAVYFIFLMSFPAAAGLIPSVPSSKEIAGKLGGEEIDRIQRVLEMQIVIDKLQAYGLSPEEVKAKLQGMTDDQRHLLAQASDRVLAGGDGLGVVIAVLIIVLLVIVILKLLDKKIIIK